MATSSSSKGQTGALIRAARERRRWTQAELGERVGVDRKTVDNWENGRTSPRNRIGALEDVLGISLRDGGATEDDGGDHVEATILADPMMTDRDKRILVDLRRSMRAGTEAARSAGSRGRSRRRADG